MIKATQERKGLPELIVQGYTSWWPGSQDSSQSHGVPSQKAESKKSCPSLPFLLNQLGVCHIPPSNQGMVTLTVGRSSHISVIPHMPVSWVIIDFIKQTINIKYRLHHQQTRVCIHECQNYSLFSFFKTFLQFLYMHILPACMSVSHMHAWALRTGVIYGQLPALLWTLGTWDLYRNSQCS